LRHRMRQMYPILTETDRVVRASWKTFGEPGPVDPTPFAYPIMDFYRTDPISRASTTMAQCSEIHLSLQRHRAPELTGTYG
jgi:NADH-quinone oxidoreductase subunit G